MIDQIQDDTYLLILTLQEKDILFMMGFRASLSPAGILEHLLSNTFKHVKEHPKPRPMDVPGSHYFEVRDLPEQGSSAGDSLDPDSSRVEPDKRADNVPDSCDNHTDEVADQNDETARMEADDDLAK